MPYINNRELLDPHSLVKKYPDGYWPDNNQESIYTYGKLDISGDIGFRTLNKDPFRRILFIDMFQGSIPSQLASTDYTAMHFGIENRSPLLSRKILPMLNEISSENFIKNGKTKAIMRDLFEKEIPQHILNNNEKKGFNAGLQDLFNLQDIKEILIAGKSIDVISENVKIMSLVSDGINDNQIQIPNGVSKLVFRILNVVSLLQ